MNNIKRSFGLLVFAFLLANVTFAQTYPKVKVTLKNGLTYVGRQGNITDNSVTFTDGGLLRTYDLKEVNFIQAKQGKAAKWALGCGGGCLGLAIISGIAVGSEGIEAQGSTVEQYALGAVLWTGIFAGVGALIGNMSDDYNNVYVSPASSSLIKRFDLGLTSNKVAKYNLTLSYKF